MSSNLRLGGPGSTTPVAKDPKQKTDSTKPPVRGRSIFFGNVNRNSTIPSIKITSVRYVPSNLRVLRQESIVDVLFFSVIALIGWSFGIVPWVTVIVHVVSSLISTVVVTASPGDKRSAEGRSVILCACASLALLTDGLFVAQIICKALDAHEEEPKLFATGADSHDLVEVSALVAAHVTSFAAAVYRTRRVTTDMEVDLSFASLGAAFAFSLLYVVWVFDFDWSSGLTLHFQVSCLLLVASISDMICTFSERLTFLLSVRPVIQTIAATFAYVSLVMSISLLFEDNVSLYFLTHHYAHVFGRVQAILILSFVFSTMVHRTVTTSPYRMARAHFVVGTGCGGTPASVGQVEKFAATVVSSLYISMYVLPTLIGVVSLFGDHTPALSRFTLLVYASWLTCRLWIQATAFQIGLFLTASVVGIIVDLLVVVDIIMWSDAFVLHNRGTAETLVSVFVVVTSGIVNTVCVAYYFYVWQKWKTQKHHCD